MSRLPVRGVGDYLSSVAPCFQPRDGVEVHEPLSAEIRLALVASPSMDGVFVFCASSCAVGHTISVGASAHAFLPT